MATLTPKETKEIDERALQFGRTNADVVYGFTSGATEERLRAKGLVRAIEKVLASTLNPTNILFDALEQYNKQ